MNQRKSKDLTTISPDSVQGGFEIWCYFLLHGDLRPEGLFSNKGALFRHEIALGGSSADLFESILKLEWKVNLRLFHSHTSFCPTHTLTDAWDSVQFLQQAQENVVFIRSPENDTPRESDMFISVNKALI